MRISSGFAAGCWLLSISVASALSPGDQYNLDQLLSGSPGGIKSAARNVHSAAGGDPQVLDVMAEQLLTYATRPGDAYIDPLAWACKALAATGNGRYYTALRSVADNGDAHRKLRGHCEKAADSLGTASGEQYAKGMAKLQQGKSQSAAQAAQPAPAANAPAGGYQPITALSVGMSQEQAYAIAGPPTSTGSHVTGKAFIPFNFKGGDSHRTIARYKGQGRVVFSNTSRYTSGMQISEVQVDPGESGFGN